MKAPVRLASKIYFSYGLLLAMALGGAVIAVLSSQQSKFHLERTHMAHEVYQHLLSLSNNAYQLFKQFGDAILIGDRDQGARESNLI